MKLHLRMNKSILIFDMQIQYFSQKNDKTKDTQLNLKKKMKIKAK